MMRKLINSVVGLWALGLLAFGAFPANALAEDDVLEIDWQQLVPKDYVPENPLSQLTSGELADLSDSSPKAQEIMAEMSSIRANSPVVEDFNGKRVKLPGYSVPLSFEGKSVSELLLVPYFGACIHVPPPPANQIVYGKLADPVTIEDPFGAVWIVGELSTVAYQGEVADAGYTMAVETIIPYEY